MGFFSVFICLLIILITAIYLFIKNQYTYWKRRGIPYDEPKFPQGNLSSTRHMRYIIRDSYHKYKSIGPFGGFYFFLSPTVFIYDLDLVKDIFIKDFNNFTDRIIFHNEEDDPLSGNLLNLKGAKWRELRNKLSPTFTSGKMKFMFPTVVLVADRLCDVMQSIVEKDPIVEVKDIVSRFTVDVIGNVGFGIECNSLKDPSAEFRQMGINAVELKRHNFLVRIFMMSFPELARKLHMKDTHETVHNFFMRVVRETVDYREKNSIKRKDFMNLLIELKNSEDSLTIEEIAAQTFIFFLAGSETSSTALGYALYELALNQEMQDKLRNEINSKIEKYNGELTYECLMEMNYLENLFKETLRKYPVITILTRSAIDDYATSNPKYVIPKGTNVFVPVDAIHHDPEIYPDPEKFDPDRFNPEEVQKRHPMSWIPFGEGQRHCIGLRFGKMQTSIGLVKLIKNFRFHFCDKTPNPLTFDPKHIILTSVGGIYLRVERI